jgi:tRNA modification GTPase
MSLAGAPVDSAPLDSAGETIFALATAAGRAAVAVVRVSGPASRETMMRLAGRAAQPRRASLRRLTAPDGAALDDALVLWMPGPTSYTGEDSLELHLHGGPAVVEAVTEALAALGLRLAEPGEFTRRAFQNGRLDLTQAEAVGDLVDAETASQARQALAQLEGGLSQRYEDWRAALLEILALLEAAVDFPDEDLPQDVASRAQPGLERLLDQIDAALADEGRGRRVRDGYRIALVGAPNAGKSSILNKLAGREAAIVTGQPGTTRDIIEVPALWSGYKVLLADTAGVRAAQDEIEAEGVRRALAWAETADMRLWVVDGSLSSGESRWAADLIRGGDILVLNKVDRPWGTDAVTARLAAEREGLPVLEISALGDLASLRDYLSGRLVAALGGSEFPSATRLRHADSLREARSRLAAALAQDHVVELAAEDVRLAARALARVTGRIDSEEILGRVFASFCIGK